MNTPSPPDFAPLEATLLADQTIALAPTLAGPTTSRVLHVINGEHFAGAERVQDLLARCLPQFGYDVSFACTKPDRFPTARHFKNAPIFELPVRGIDGLKAPGRLAELVRENDFQIIHAHTPRSVTVASLASAKTKTPLVYHVHSPTSRDTTRRMKNWINSTVEKFSLRNAAALITVSNSLAEHMQAQGYGPERVHVVHNGVPTHPFNASKQTPQGLWTIGTMALFRPRKGTEVLLQAIAMLHQRGHQIRLRAVGPFESAEYEGKLKGICNRLGIEPFVDWCGFASDVNAELNQMDLFALPSLFGEGLPMVVLEAMACGVPVVGTRVEGVPEAIREGTDGLIATPNDSVDMANQLEKLIRGRLNWQTLRRQAFERQSENFSDISMAAGVARVYDAVLRASDSDQSAKK